MIWRVECPDCGFGPYRCTCRRAVRQRVVDQLREAHYGDRDRPPSGLDRPYAYPFDGPLPAGWLHGFRDLAQAQRWFKGWGLRFAYVGWVLSAYAPPARDDVQYLGHQVLLAPTVVATPPVQRHTGPKLKEVLG